MSAPDPVPLMHLVLDGEATAEEARQLELALVADPALRAEYGELKNLFAELRRVPEAEAPPALEPAILQLFDHFRVSDTRYESNNRSHAMFKRTVFARSSFAPIS